MVRYSVVLLDADGTLFDYDRAEATALTTCCNDLGIPCTPERDIPRYRQINREVWSAFERGEIDQDTLAVERFRRLLAELRHQADPREMSERYLSRLAEGSYLIDGALEVVAALSQRARLAILTNGLSRVQRARFAASGLDAYIPHLFISDEIGSQKPEPEIFARALEPFPGIARSEALMVGDSLSSDIRGGVNYGLPTCWYNPDGQENPDGPTPTHEISDLEELLFLL